MGVLERITRDALALTGLLFFVDYGSHGGRLAAAASLAAIIAFVAWSTAEARNAWRRYRQRVASTWKPVT